jgi:DNA repair photolyase
LEAAKVAGLNVYVAMAPTYPECDEDDLRATLKAVKSLKPVTIFHEPINIRAENVARIEAQAQRSALSMRSDVFATRESWQDYALESLRTVHKLARELGLANRLHLWPDRALGSASVIRRQKDPGQFLSGLHRSWQRVSEWP